MSENLRRAVSGFDHNVPLIEFDDVCTADGSAICESTHWQECGFVQPVGVGKALARRSCGINGITDIT